MELRDTAKGKETAAPPSPEKPGAGAGRAHVDRFEMKPHWTQRTEEEQVEAAEALYERAARQRMQPASPPPPIDSEELEALSQELRLQQKCQDIAAQVLVDELEEDLDGEEPE